MGDVRDFGLREELIEDGLGNGDEAEGAVKAEPTLMTGIHIDAKRTKRCASNVTRQTTMQKDRRKQEDPAEREAKRNGEQTVCERTV
jgi:hypothetical protein